MHYEYPDDETLGRYLAMLRNVLVDVRHRAYTHDPQAAELLDAVENVPDLLSRWPECNSSMIVGQLQHYESKYSLSPNRYSKVLLEEPPSNWQLRTPSQERT